MEALLEELQVECFPYLRLMFMKTRHKEELSEGQKQHLRSKISEYACRDLAHRLCKEFDMDHKLLGTWLQTEDPKAAEFRQKLASSIDDILERKIPSHLDYHIIEELKSPDSTKLVMKKLFDLYQFRLFHAVKK